MRGLSLVTATMTVVQPDDDRWFCWHGVPFAHHEPSFLVHRGLTPQSGGDKGEKLRRKPIPGSPSKSWFWTETPGTALFNRSYRQMCLVRVEESDTDGAKEPLL